MKKTPSDILVVTKNRKAFHDFQIDDKIEAGLVLMGSEVKSLRAGKVNLADSYAIIKDHEVWLLHAHIAPYDPASIFGHEPRRTRKLLLHAREIAKLAVKLHERGLTLVPLMVYFRKGHAKVELGLGRGKKQYDKRASIKKRESNRELSAALKRRR